MDHVVPLALGGADEEDNMQAVCRGCDGAKTPGDLKAIKKADRIRAKAAKPARKPKAKRYRGVDGRVKTR